MILNKEVMKHFGLIKMNGKLSKQKFDWAGYVVGQKVFEDLLYEQLSKTNATSSLSFLYLVHDMKSLNRQLGRYHKQHFLLIQQLKNRGKKQLQRNTFSHLCFTLFLTSSFVVVARKFQAEASLIFNMVADKVFFLYSSVAK